MEDFDAGFMQAARIMGPQTMNPQDTQGLIIEFYIEPIENEEKTKKAGRLICDDVEYVSIRIPGDIDVQRHPATQEDRERFPVHYEAWKKRQPQETVSGTPLTKWPGSPSLSRVKEAAALGIHTVEQLSAVTDSNISRLGSGWLAIRQKARDYLAAAKDSALLFQLRSENEALATRLKALEESFNRQSAELDKARANGGTLPAQTNELDALKAMVANLATQLQKPPDANGAPKRRGRPPGSKNKPKPEPQPS